MNFDAIVRYGKKAREPKTGIEIISKSEWWCGGGGGRRMCFGEVAIAMRGVSVDGHGASMGHRRIALLASFACSETRSLGQ